MSSVGARTILLLNRFFETQNHYFDAMVRSKGEAFEYSIRSGEVVYRQFDGFNDFTGKIVLDYGCGAGGKTVAYARMGPKRVIGVDLTHDFAAAADYARRHHLPVSFLPIGEDGRMALADHSVDVVISSSVLEHVMDLPATLDEMHRVLKPGGRCLNRWHPFHTRHGAHLGAAIGLPYVHRLFSEATVVHAYYRSLDSKFGATPSLVRPLKGCEPDLGKLDLPLNRLTIRAMRETVTAAGFEIVERRFLRGTRRMKLPRWLPEAAIELVCDYEVQICRAMPRREMNLAPRKLRTAICR